MLAGAVALGLLVAALGRIGEAAGRALLVLALALPACSAVWWWASGRRRAGGGRPPGPGWASRRELSPLLCRAVAGDRVVLGRAHGRLVAAEHRQSVLVVGPSQSGKTTGLAVPAIVEWAGPVLATSVKTDLLGASLAARSARGEVAVFDPTGVTGEPSFGWSPLDESGSWRGARRVAEALCSVGERSGGIEDASYWYAAAERLLAPLLQAAALSGGSMGEVLCWLEEEEVDAPLSVLAAAGEEAALRVARSCFALEERQRSSVFATALTVLAAYEDPDVLASERFGRRLSPTWLLAGGPRPRTIYCCAPARDQARLSPVFVALVRQVLDAAYQASLRGGGPLDPPVLVVLDEAANVAPLGDLDQVLSTAAGHGICLLTVWQDLAQVEVRYGARWATIVNNHRAKVVCPGVSDPRTLELVSALLGDAESSQRSRGRGEGGGWTESETEVRLPVAPAGWIRRLPRRQALVVYGGLPPALVSLRGVLPPGRRREAAS